ADNTTVIPDVAVGFARTAGNGSTSAGVVITDENGRAAVTLTLGTAAGANTFTAASGTLIGSPVTINISGTAGAAAQLVKISGDSQTGAVGTGLANPLIVEARDADGNVKSGVAVTFTVGGGNGSVAPTGVQSTGSNGRVQITATLGTAVAIHQFTASAPGLASVVFSETGTLTPANVTITAGNNQTVAPGISLLTPLKVHVTNAAGIIVPNAA